MAEHGQGDERIAFRIERDVLLDPLWFDPGWYDELRTDGLSHEDALMEIVRVSVSEDPISVLWEAFGPAADGLVASITRIALTTTAA